MDSKKMKQFLGKLDEAMVTNGFDDKGSRVVGRVTFGLESSNESISSANDLEATFTRSLKAAMNAIDVDNEEFVPSQEAMADMLSKAALGSRDMVEAARDGKLKPSQEGGRELKDVAVTAFGLDDIRDFDSYGMEAFDGQDVAKTVRFTAAYNIAVSRQDEFSDAFLPIVVIDPTVGTAKFVMQTVNMYNDFARSITGSTDAAAYGKKPLIKAAYTDELLGDKNMINPVKRAPDNADKLFHAIELSLESRGETVVSSPIRVGVNLSLLGVSQTDTSLTKGVSDVTEALDRSMSVKRVYFSLTGESRSGVVTEYFDVNARSLAGSNFLPGGQGHNKDLTLQNFEYNSITITTDGAQKMLGGSTSTVANTLPDGYVITLGFVLNGKSNTQTSDTVVYQSSAKLISAVDANGDAATGADLTAITTVTDSFAIVGYTLEAYATNSDNRNRGQLIGVDIVSQAYPVPVRTGSTVLKTLSGDGVDNDTAYLSGQVVALGLKMSQAAVHTINDWETNLRAIKAANGVGFENLIGVASEVVNFSFLDDALNLATDINTVRSGEKSEDIKGLIVSRIRDHVTRMFTESNMKVARRLAQQDGRPIDVVVGTSSRIAAYIGNTVEIGTEFNVKVVTTSHPFIGDKIYLTFGDFETSKNNKPNPLAFGCTFMAPSVTVDLPRSSSGSVIREITDFPRFLHVAQLPVMTVMTVTGLDTVLGKTAIDYNDVTGS